MGKPYSMDLRERVVAAIENGESTHQAAARFAIGIATAGVWARLKRSTGDVRPAKQGKPKGAVLDAHADFILGVLAKAPDTTLDEMVERLRDERCQIAPNSDPLSRPITTPSDGAMTGAAEPTQRSKPVLAGGEC
jgi:transposase